MRFASGTVLLATSTLICCIVAFSSSEDVEKSLECVPLSKNGRYFAFVNENGVVSATYKNAELMCKRHGGVVWNINENGGVLRGGKSRADQTVANETLHALRELAAVKDHQLKDEVLQRLNVIYGNNEGLAEGDCKWYLAGPFTADFYTFTFVDKCPGNDDPSPTSWFICQRTEGYDSTSTSTSPPTITTTPSSTTTRREINPEDEKTLDDIDEAIETEKDAGELIRKITAGIENLTEPFEGLETFRENLLRSLETLIGDDTGKARNATEDLLSDTIPTLARNISQMGDYDRVLDFVSDIAERIASRTEPDNTNITNVTPRGTPSDVLFRLLHRELDANRSYDSHVETSTVETKLNGRFPKGSIITTHMEFKNEKLKEEMIRSRYKRSERFSSDIVEFFVRLPGETEQSQSIPLTVDLYFKRETKQVKRALEHTCVFYNATTEELDDSGCTFKGLENGKIRCRCNHTTSFGSIFIPNSFDENFEYALDIFSYIMDVFSLSALLLSILIFTLVRQIRTVLTIIHLNLCISLFVTELIIVFHNIAFTAFPDFKCGKLLGMLVHYSILTVIAWSTLEGVYILQLMIVVFKPPESHTRYYLMFGYIVPLIYPLIALPFSTYATQSGQLCFLESKMSSGPYWSFLAPLMIMLGVNIVAISTVMYRLCTINRSVKTVKSDLIRYLRGILCMTALLGLQWGLGIVSVFFIDEWNGIKFTCIFLFVFFTLAQGPLIFVVHIMLVKDTRYALARYLAKRGRFSRCLANFIRPPPPATETHLHHGSSSTRTTEVASSNHSSSAPPTPLELNRVANHPLRGPD